MLKLGITLAWQDGHSISYFIVSCYYVVTFVRPVANGSRVYTLPLTSAKEPLSMLASDIVG